ncbi:aldehyde dehydrogenase family protein [Fulvivirgaceae bacterium BMA10]|uniref:Aldehyde dehydrogenase family protein n=1 Tax=Splendidivirga corallicola TaxID=3051826 RepID=A0ABT8KM12_9BACT|nr:aldehyde dehydrogenase family protein [Fulvivirgaceae bacterium BMA10]
MDMVKKNNQPNISQDVLFEFGSIINGKEHRSGDWLEVFNPFTKQQVGRVASINVEVLEQTIRKTHDTKLTLSRYERNGILNKMADVLEDSVEEVSRLITHESGLSLKDTKYEASRVADVLRFSAMKAFDDDSEVFPCDISRNGRNRRIYTSRHPLPLIAAITPFNHPMNQVVHKIAPAIATNNTVILKPSEKTPLSAYYLAKVALECGLPPNALNVVNGPVQQTANHLVKHDLVSLVSFTGSSQIGKLIAGNAGYKKLILELGGSSALLVLGDADIDEAVSITISGTFKNSAQRCTAIRRVLVQEEIADVFSARLANEVAKIKYGNPYDPSMDMGTVINESAAIEIENRVNASIAAGAQLLIGNERDGALYSPTVLDHMKNHYPVAAEETFGPVAPIIRFKTLDEAISIANDTPYGLSGGIVSNHWPSIQKVISALETGTVNVNEAPSYRLEWTPFGGIKDSGLGYKEGVIETMKGYTYMKTYSLPWDMP